MNRLELTKIYGVGECENCGFWFPMVALSHNWCCWECFSDRSQDVCPDAGEWCNTCPGKFDCPDSKVANVQRPD
jgi:hypothetical protein